MAKEEKQRKGGLSQPRNLATLLSVIFPGLGQLYNRRIMKGIILFIVAASFLITTWNYIDIGIWGLFTLGTIPRDHHSIQLLLQGLISLIVLSFAIAIYIFNIKEIGRASCRERGYYMEGDINKNDR